MCGGVTVFVALGVGLVAGFVAGCFALAMSVNDYLVKHPRQRD